MQADHHITVAERDALRSALGADDAHINQAGAWAAQAGYERGELAGAVLEAWYAPRPEGRPGPKPIDPLRAAIFAGSPLDNERDLRGIVGELSAHACYGVDGMEVWADAATRTRPLPITEFAQQCVADRLRELHPGDTRTDRRDRDKERNAVDAGQGGFAGLGWALPNKSHNDREDHDELDAIPEGEPA